MSTSREYIRDLFSLLPVKPSFKWENIYFTISACLIKLYFFRFYTAGSCFSERAGCKKPTRSERPLGQSICFIVTDKK